MITYVFWWLWCSSAVKGLWSRFLWYHVASLSDFIFPCLTPAVKSITFPDVFHLYVSNHFIRAFQMLDVGLISPTLCVCLPSCSVLVSLFGFCFCFPPPSRSVGAEEAALIAKLHRAQMLKLSETFLWSGEEIWPNWGKAALMKGLDGELIMSNFTNEALHQQC